MLPRILGVLKLNVETYEEIEHDEAALSQAVMIVAAVSVLTAVGQALSGEGASSVVGSLVGSLVGWWVGAWVVYKVGTSMFAGQAEATHAEMLRVLGFAQAPMAFSVFSGIPAAGWLISLIAAIWSLCCYFIAVRQGLDVSNFQAFITICLVCLVYIGVIMAIAIGIGSLAVMLGLSLAA